MKDIIKSGLYSLITKIIGDKDDFVFLPVIKGPAEGIWLKLDLINRKESSYLLGKYDLFILEILDKLIEPGWIIWDCGTYLGFYTCYFAKAVGKAGHVYGFEPDPNNYDRTKNNLHKNNLENHTLFNYAIGSSKENISFILSQNSNSHLEGAYIDKLEEYKLNREEVDTQISVRSYSLDELFYCEKLTPPNLIKIDIEGAEVEAFNETVKLQGDIKPIFLVELHNNECFRAAWEFANKSDYVIYNLHKNLFAKSLEDVNETVLCFHSSQQEDIRNKLL